MDIPGKLMRGSSIISTNSHTNKSLQFLNQSNSSLFDYVKSGDTQRVALYLQENNFITLHPMADEKTGQIFTQISPKFSSTGTLTSSGSSKSSSPPSISSIDPNYYYEKLNEKDWQGRTPLIWASMLNHITIVKLLLAAETFLITTMSKDSNELFLNKKRNLRNEVDDQGRSALHWAAVEGNFEITSLLIGFLSKYFFNNKTLTVKNDHFKLLKFTSNNLTYKFTSRENVYQNLSQEFLLDPILADPLRILGSYCNTTLIDKQGNIPLIYSSMHGYLYIVELLINNHLIDSNSVDIPKVSLKSSSNSGRKKIPPKSVRISEKKVNYIVNPLYLDFQDKDKRTPLSWAAGQGHTNIVHLLLACNADKDGNVKIEDSICNGPYFPPIFYAVLNNMYSVVLILALKAKCSKCLLYNNPQLKQVVKRETNNSNSNSRNFPSLESSPKIPKSSAKVLSLNIPNLAPIITGASAPTSSSSEEVAIIESVTLPGYAVRNNSIQMLFLLISCGCNLDAKDSDGRTPLSLACEYGYIEIVNILLLGRANPNLSDINGLYPIHYAAKGGWINIITLLLNKGASINITENNGLTPLSYLIKIYNPDVLEQNIKQKNPTPNLETVSTLSSPGDIKKLTPDELKLEIIDTCIHLIDSGCDLTIAEQVAGRTALHLAVISEMEDVIKRILGGSIDIEAVDSNGKTALMYAVQLHNVSIVKMLLKNGANIFTQSCVPLSSSSSWLSSFSIKSNENKQANRATTGKCIIHYAVEARAVSIISLLISNYEECYESSWKILSYVSAIKDIDQILLTNLLLENGYNINCYDKGGRTPLINACINNNVKLVQTLLNYNANILLTDFEGMTPLAYTYDLNKNIEIMLMLVRRLKDIFENYSNGILVAGYTKAQITFAQSINIDLNTLISALENNDMFLGEHILRNYSKMLRTNLDLVQQLTSLAGEGRIDIYKKLLKSSPYIDVNTFDKKGKNSLIAAVEKGQHRMVEFLLSYNELNINHHDSLGQHPLAIALHNGDITMIIILTNYMINIINSNESISNSRMIYYAKNHFSFSQNGSKRPDNNHRGSSRISKKSSIFNSNDHIQSAINIALASYGHQDKFIPQKFGYSSPKSNLMEPHYPVAATLTSSIKQGLNDIVNYFITKASVHPYWAKDERNRCALSIAAEEGNGELIELFVNYGCSQEYKDRFGRTPLMIACMEGRSEVIQQLIILGCNKEARDYKLRTPLFLASKERQYEVVQQLINLGCNKETPDNCGRTPLIYAAEINCISVLEVLINSQAHIEARDLQGSTALMLASEEGNIETLELLLKKIDEIENYDHKRKESWIEEVGEAYESSVANLQDVWNLGLFGHPSIFESLSIATSLNLDLSGEYEEVFSSFEFSDPSNKPSINSPTNSTSISNSSNNPIQPLVKNSSVSSTNSKNASCQINPNIEMRNSHEKAGLDLIMMQIEQRCGKDGRNFLYNTALILAAKEGQNEACEILCQAGCDPLLMDSKGLPALLHAASNGHINVMETIRKFVHLHDKKNAKDKNAEGEDEVFLNDCLYRNINSTIGDAAFQTFLSTQKDFYEESSINLQNYSNRFAKNTSQKVVSPKTAKSRWSVKSSFSTSISSLITIGSSKIYST